MKPSYWIILIVVLGIAAFGGYKLWHHYNTKAMMQNSQKTAMVNISNQPTSPTPSTNSSSAGGLPNKTNTSNQQLNQDLQNIQNSMNQLQQDQATANQDANNQSQDTPQQ